MKGGKKGKKGGRKDGGAMRSHKRQWREIRQTGRKTSVSVP